MRGQGEDGLEMLSMRGSSEGSRIRHEVLPLQPLFPEEAGSSVGVLG